MFATMYILVGRMANWSGMLVCIVQSLTWCNCIIFGWVFRIIAAIVVELQ